MPSLVNDTTFQLSDTGVVINDDTLANQPFIDIEQVSGLDSAPFRQTKREHEGVDGGFMDAEFESGRDIALVGIVYANNNPMETFLDKLKANWAPSTTLVPLYIYTLETGLRVVYVKPLGVKYDWDALRRTGMCAVTFSAFAEDPRIYSGTLLSSVIPMGATVFSGFGFNLGFNFGFGGVSTTADGAFVYNVGNRPAPCTLTVTGPITNPVIQNDTVSAAMVFNITLLSTDTLVIDTQYHTVRLNGANRRSTMTYPGWFMLEADPVAAGGGNFIRLRGSAGTGTLTVSYRASWR